MLIQLPPNDMHATLQSLYPEMSPGLRRRLTTLWEMGAGIQWTQCAPFDAHARSNVEQTVQAFLAYLHRRHQRFLGAQSAPAEIAWAHQVLENPVQTLADRLAGGPASGLCSEVQARFGQVEMPTFLRIVRAGARTLGMPPVLIWEGEAQPARLPARNWSRIWKELDVALPSLARPLASWLLTMLTAATLESVGSELEDSPYTAIVSVGLSGAWPVLLEDPSCLWLVDIGALVRI